MRTARDARDRHNQSDDQMAEKAAGAIESTDKTKAKPLDTINQIHRRVL